MNIEIKDNAVLRDGEQIGVIKDGTCYSPAAIAGRVKGAINEANGEKLTFVVGGIPENIEAVQPAPVAPTLPPASHPQVEVLPSPESIVNPPSQVQLDVEAIMKRVAAGEIPHPPKTRGDLGDKTPVYVEWYRTHATPEQFARRYDHRKLPTLAEADEDERKRIAFGSKAGGDYQVEV